MIKFHEYELTLFRAWSSKAAAFPAPL